MPLILGANSVSGYTVKNSLRFNSGSSDYLNRTPASNGNRTTWTWSGWIKRSKLGSDSVIFDAGDASNYTPLFFNSFDYLRGYEVQGNVLQSFNLITTQVFRDVSAWYHIVFAVDTTQATSTNRIKLYVNGEQITSLSTASYPAQNYNTIKNSTSYPNYIGRYSDAVNGLFNGYISEVNFIDGQQLTPSSFGETDTLSGIWIPKSYSGSYGTNGFNLQFKNSASLGTDSSGNGNTFTVNNLTSIDQTTDTPTNNFCTINPLIPISSAPTFSEGNLRVVSSTANWRQSGCTFGVSTGKWYWEGKGVSGAGWLALHGIKKAEIASQSENYNYPTGYNDGAYSYYIDGTKYVNGTNSAYGNSWTVTDTISVALDCDNNYLYFAKNGTWQNSGVPTSGATGTGGISITSGQTWLPFVTTHAGGLDMNFGNPPYSANSYTDGAGFGNFSYSVPSGYYSLNTKNLADYG